jgi:hypothetical protein
MNHSAHWLKVQNKDNSAIGFFKFCLTMKKFSHFIIENEIGITRNFQFKFLKIFNNNFVQYLNVILYIMIIFFLDNAT